MKLIAINENSSYINTYIYIYIQRERERKRKREKMRDRERERKRKQKQIYICICIYVRIYINTIADVNHVLMSLMSLMSFRSFMSFMVFMPLMSCLRRLLAHSTTSRRLARFVVEDVLLKAFRKVCEMFCGKCCDQEFAKLLRKANHLPCF